MVGGTIFHRRVIQREISRVLVLNLSGNRNGAQNTDRTFLSLTAPSLLSRASPQGWPAAGSRTAYRGSFPFAVKLPAEVCRTTVMSLPLVACKSFFQFSAA